MKGLLFLAAALPSAFAQALTPDPGTFNLGVKSDTVPSLVNQVVSIIDGGWLGLKPDSRTNWDKAAAIHYVYLAPTQTFSLSQEGKAGTLVTLREVKIPGLLGLHTGPVPWLADGKKDADGAAEGFDQFFVANNTGVVTVKNGLDKAKWVIFSPKGVPKDQFAVGLWDGVAAHPDTKFDEVALIAYNPTKFA